MGTVAVAALGYSGKPFFEILLWPCPEGGSMTKIFKLLYGFLIGLFWISTFGFGSMATVCIIYICLREFGKATSFAIYSVLFLVGSIISVLLGMAIDVMETKYKVRRW